CWNPLDPTSPYSCVTTNHACALSDSTKLSAGGFVLVSVEAVACRPPYRRGAAHLARLFPNFGETVCDAITQIGPAAAPLTGQVLPHCNSNDWDLQWAVADALGYMGSSDPAGLAALTAALGHDSGIVVSAAARALARIGPAAVPALSDILLQPEDP